MTEPTDRPGAGAAPAPEDEIATPLPVTMVADDAAGCVVGVCEWPIGEVEGSGSES